LQQTEQDLLARVAELESDLAGQKAAEETLRLEMQNTVQELHESRSKNEVLENRVVNLQDNLRETVEASKKRESNALAMAQTEAKHTATILESKLQSCEQQLAKAEEREAQALLQSQEARQDISNLHQSMTNNIASTRREMSAQHRVELDKINIELDASKQEITHLSDQLQEAKNSFAKQTEKSDKNLNDAECRIKDINNDLESKTEECERLQAELDEVIYEYGWTY
jgi:predicted  nucleic acid-binding Zn-ribbon protein